MPFLSIHTATYNRGYILGQAYKSLCRQTNKDFEWIITDDGSTDNTRDIVADWKNRDNGFNIIYNLLPHVGIPRALNSGVQMANTKWFMMLDSDDYLVPYAVERILSWIKEIENAPEKEQLGGVGCCRCFPNGSYMKKQKPIIDPNIGYLDATHIERSLFNLDMDCCEVHNVNLLKRFPFLCWETEKYAPEQLSFFSMALDGWKLRWRDEKLYVCNYLPDGQTMNNRLVADNPMGFAMMYNQKILINRGIKNHWRDVVQMIALSFASGNMHYLKETNDKWATLFLMFPGILLGVRRIFQFKTIRVING